MNADLLLLALADGFSYAGLLFLVALGLTLIFGVMGILNVAHGSLYAFGGYTAATFVAAAGGAAAGNLVLLGCLFVAARLVGVALGVTLELGLLRRVQDKDPVIQLLITFAAFMILEDVLRLIWGTQPYTASDVVTGLKTIDVFGATYTRYQLLLIPAVALIVYGALQYFLRSTRTGKQMIAATHNAEIATAMGINAKRIRLVTFVLGAVLGALGGALAAPTTSLVPGVGTDMIVLSFAVIATAVHLLPQVELFVIYAVMTVVLILRPYGLFARAQARRI